MPWGKKKTYFIWKKNIKGNNIKYYIYIFVLKQEKLSGTYFKPSARALKYSENQQRTGANLSINSIELKKTLLYYDGTPLILKKTYFR